MDSLKPLKSYAAPQGPVVLAIMDGVALGRYPEGDMVRQASTPNLDRLKTVSLHTSLKAHGKAVGMPTDADMGNSEVGHNAIGCGRVFDQGASLVRNAIADRSIFEGDVWKELVAYPEDHGGALHFIGLLSDGNVHSHIDHLFAMLAEAKALGVVVARVHVLLDGRDVPPTSALEYVDRLEDELKRLNENGSVDYRIASGGGRLNITMDRYEANWDMVARGWQVHVKGEGPAFASAREAVGSHRADNPGVLDQDLPPFVVVEDEKPVGPILDGDSVILFNFRGDRAMELTRAFEEESFDKFNREPMPRVKFAGMMEYDEDLKIPRMFLVSPPAIDRTMGEYLTQTGVSILAVSETQKFGHVTYFFNGNRTKKFDQDLETYVDISSDNIPFEQRPAMKAKEITDVVVPAIENKSHRFIRLNYPNGDMVGHTGVNKAVVESVEAVDEGVGRLMSAVEKAGGILVVTADHGNADEMMEFDKNGEMKIDAETGTPKSKTSHSLNPVPVFIYDPAKRSGLRMAGLGPIPAGYFDDDEFTECPEPALGISSLAATCIVLLGYEPPGDYTPSLVQVC